MKELKKAVINEVNSNYKDRFKKIKTEEGLKHLLGFYGKAYKKNPQEKFKRFLELRQKKEIDDYLKQIDEVSKAQDFSGDFIITVEWKKSYMWGKNPRAYTNYGFNGSSIGGCGYCKQSTATAEALNSHLPILKRLYQVKNDYLRKHKITDHNEVHRQILGYGSGYGVLPRFEGGVGVSCHQHIIEGVGLKWRNITSTSNTDVYMVSR